MSLTTIPLQEETKNALRQFKNEFESWDVLINRLIDHEIARLNTQLFFNADTLSLYGALEEIEKW